mmetsp:Transcript_11169/g.22966  ORF Transcript_11169/g.22966 Transcript_11169/m.22966 type:complete len:606 (+) Transcript_11169:118-1935(+)
MANNDDHDDVIEPSQVETKHEPEICEQQNDNIGTNARVEGKMEIISPPVPGNYDIPQGLKNSQNNYVSAIRNNGNTSSSRSIGSFRSANDDDDNCSISVKSHKSDANSRISSSSLTRKRHGFHDFMSLLRKNRNYRIYLASHLCQHAGDWFVHVASLIAIEQLSPDSGTAISILIATRMIPMILFTSLGGALADIFDKRKLMIALDAWNSFVALFYLLALRYKSVSFLYVVSFIRNSFVAIYEPITRSIVPLFMENDDDLKSAVTMNGMAWALTLTFGGTLAGWTAARLGAASCFLVDSGSYIVSAMAMCMVKGNYCVREQDRATYSGEKSSDSGFKRGGRCETLFRNRRLCMIFTPVLSFGKLSMELFGYLVSCKFTMLVFMKATGNITRGSADVINVHYAHIDGDVAATSSRVGIIYSSVGTGCLLGPFVANYFTNIDRVASLQGACIIAMGINAFGWIGISSASSFPSLCLFNSVRSFGGSIIWINSTLLLQKLVPNKILGRVLSFDFAVTMFCDTMVSFATGIRIDSGISTRTVALGSAGLMGILWVFWSSYHIARMGAARKSLNSEEKVSVPSVALLKGGADKRVCGGDGMGWITATTLA